MATITNQKQSSLVQSVEYDPHSRDLTVTLHGNRTYVYPNRTAEEHNAFVSAESHGRHFNAVVKHWPHRS